MNRLNIEFGIPEHGWLPMSFSYKDFKIELEISDIPVDPMEQLCNSLIEINKNIQKPNRVLWHLEPYCYYLQLLKLEENKYKVIILESEKPEGKPRVTNEISGAFEEMVYPFYKALKDFCSKSYKSPHWGQLDAKRIDELTNLIKDRKKV